MVKTVIEPKEGTYNLQIPANYIGKKVEVLFYTLDEITENKQIKTKLSDKYKNAFSKEDAKSFDEHTKNMRNEWNDI